MSNKKEVHTSGKRKEAIARSTLKKGEGIIRIDKKRLENYTPENKRMEIKEPILLAGDLAEDIDMKITVSGGGKSGQAEAIRNAIAKGLVEFTGSDELEEKYLDYDRHLLVADTRRTEPQKPCRSAPRASKQTSKR